jgi:hypothetical protein
MDYERALIRARWATKYLKRGITCRDHAAVASRRALFLRRRGIAAFLHRAFTDGLEWRDWLFLIFLWPHILLEARDV